VRDPEPPDGGRPRAEIDSQPPAPVDPRQTATFARFAVDDELCIGCGLCHLRAPENVEVPDGSMVASVTRQAMTAEEESNLTEAARFCPTGGLAES